MNLYNYHSNPEQLHGYEQAHESVPIIIWEKYKKNPEELRKREDILAQDPEYSYRYARDVLNGPFPKGEDAIAQRSAMVLSICS
jgi:hypothetical protein